MQWIDNLSIGFRGGKINTCTKRLRNALFVDSTDSIVEKMAVMMRTATEEKVSLKWCFGTLLSFIVRSVDSQIRS
jgi:hypothetical protein